MNHPKESADKQTEEQSVKHPKLQSLLKVVMLLCAAVLVVVSTWVEKASCRQPLLLISGGVLSVGCLVFAWLNFDQLKQKKEEL